MRERRRRKVRSLRRSRPSADGWWQSLGQAGLYLAIGAPAVAIMAIIWFYSPIVTIQPAAMLNLANVNNAEFAVSNTGRVTVYNLLFQCEIIQENGGRLTTSGNIVHLPSGRVVEQSVSTVSPNENITRNCGLGAAVSPRRTVSIIATAKYTWPLVKWTGYYTRRFSSRQDQRGGIALVPDP